MKHEYFPPEVIFLQEELTHHPKAMEMLSRIPSDDLGNRIAALCTYCNILVDDSFNQRELADLCNQITKNLYNMRTSIILPH